MVKRIWIIGHFRKQVHGVTYPSCNVRFLSSYSLNTYTCSSFKTPKYLDAYVMLVKTSWLKGVGLSRWALCKKIRITWYSATKPRAKPSGILQLLAPARANWCCDRLQPRPNRRILSNSQILKPEISCLMGTT